MSDADKPASGDPKANKPAPPPPDGKEPTATKEHQDQPTDYLREAKNLLINIWSWSGKITIWLDGHNGLLTAIATIVIAALTWVLAGYANDQGKILTRQIEDAELSQRAFLFISDSVTNPTTDDQGRSVLRIVPKWTNSGETPTRNARLSSFCGHKVEEFDYRTPDSLPDLVGPKQTKANGNCDVIIIPSALALKSGRIGVAGVGAKAVYFDVFGKRHVSEFCATYPIIQTYDPKTGLLDVGAGTTFTYCPEHNCADEECPAEDRN